ncbi:SGNH/GDSL hydrolase family protein [Dyella sp. ASV21]|uniref:SGNH/GDSL hydrolase family protein n=1 Tax=Dyella sp. ASV21 TaxID=2795114 RepID=UPI001E4E33CE|nr:SGNH/GDSL hydrolase family protein [Dyella sp. ASV21]
MPPLWIFPIAILTAALCAVATPTVADDTASGIAANPCAGLKGPDDMPETQWKAYLFAHDFGQLCHYRAQNAALRADNAAPRVVFMGDSITESWGQQHPAFFTAGKLDRGISGQTTAQMLLRFRQDVIELHPQAVHILAGTNDIAGNTGPSTLEQVEANIVTMAELAQIHHIRVILASVPPAANFPWRPQLRIGDTIQALNAWMKSYAERQGFIYVDYYTAMATPSGAMQPALSKDGVHPTRKGYEVMEPLTDKAIRQALASPPHDEH